MTYTIRLNSNKCDVMILLPNCLISNQRKQITLKNACHAINVFINIMYIITTKYNIIMIDLLCIFVEMETGKT